MSGVTVLIAWLGTAAITHTLTSPLHPQSAAWFCYSLTLWLCWSSIVAVAALVILDTVAPGVQASVPAALRFVSATPLLILGLTQIVASIDQRPGLRMPGFAVLLALVAANLWLLLT